MSLILMCDNIKEIFLVPYKIDKEGTIYITPMLRSEIGEERLKRLVNMGIFSSEEKNNDRNE